jgi:hypothetical protein
VDDSVIGVEDPAGIPLRESLRSMLQPPIMTHEFVGPLERLARPPQLLDPGGIAARHFVGPYAAAQRGDEA